MIDYSGPIFQEIRELLQQYTDMDPDGFWDYEEWEAYARAHASEALLKYMKKKGKYWFYNKKREDNIL